MIPAPASVPVTAPLILTATMGARDFAWADSLRRLHFPPDRNFIPAHITLFHHLPPARLPELSRLLRACTQGEPSPSARLSEVMFIGRGVAFRVESPALLLIRSRIADWFRTDLTAQDQHAPRLHITVQNKVAPDVARTLHGTLAVEFQPRPLVIAGLAIWAYLGGPWQLIREHKFKQSHA